jgi:hypothetical protein
LLELVEARRVLEVHDVEWSDLLAHVSKGYLEPLLERQNDLVFRTDQNTFDFCSTW